MADLVLDIKPSGGDYPDFEAAEAGEQSHLINDGNTVTLDFYPMEDTTPVTILGWTMDVDHDLTCRLPDGYQPDGERLDEDAYFMSVTSGETAVSCEEDFVRFEYFQIRADGSSGTSYCMGFSNSHFVDLRFLSCRHDMIGSAAVGYNFNGTFIDTGGFIKFQNCVWDGDNASWPPWNCGVRWISGAGQAGTLYVYNCSFYELYCGYWLDLGGDGALCVSKNNGFDGCVNDYNAAADPPTTEVTNSESTPTWDTYFLLDGADSVWRIQGTDLTSDGGRLNELDFLGNARPDGSAWSIGAHEPTAGATQKSVSDSGGGAEAVSVKGILGISEVGSGSDAVAVSKDAVPKSVSDVGVGTDVISSILAAISILDSGGGVDAVSISAILGISDTGGGVDEVSLLGIILIPDAGTGTDEITEVKGILVLSDAGGGVESVSIVGLIPAVDVGSGAEVVAVYTGGEIQKSVSDIGSGSGAIGILSEVDISDIGSGSGAIGILSEVDISDLGVGIEEILRIPTGLRPLIFSVVPRERISDVTPRRRMFSVPPRERISDVEPRKS